MTRLLALSGVICTLALGLTACDVIAFPGFAERPGTETPTAPVGDQPSIPHDPIASDPPHSPPQDETDSPQPTDPVEPHTPDETTSPTDETAPPTEGSTDEPSEPTTGLEPPPAEPDPDPVPEPELEPRPPTFSYHAPGDLIAGSGLGSPDRTIYAPDMVFPIQTAPTFPQSMVFQPGGFRYDGDLPADECIPENYVYPWRDNFCERGRRSSFKSPHCPAVSGVHLGQDIRVGDAPGCNAMRRTYRNTPQNITRYRVVAAEDGIITNISTYTVSLKAGPRTYRYLHMNMRALQVSIGDPVSAGQHLGYVSKDFGFRSDGSRRPTTFHLHFELIINSEDGTVFVPPYTSLVAAYVRREGGPGEEIERSVVAASNLVDWDPDEVFESME